MTRNERETADRLADATLLALEGASMRMAARELGFPDAGALALFLTQHRRAATARRLWANGHPSRAGLRGRR